MSGHMMDGYGMMDGIGWKGMAVTRLLWIVVLALVAWGLIYLLRTRQPLMQPAAVEIRKRRLAHRDPLR